MLSEAMLGEHLLKYLALFWAPFAHEDLAIVTAAFFVHEHGLPIVLVFASLYAGVIVSDLAIYGLGRAARSVPKLRRLVSGDKLQRASIRLKDNLILSVAFCRLLPGLLFPTFIACGWLGVPLWRFLITTMIASAVYSIVMLGLVLAFGAAIVKWIGLWGWVILAVLAVILAGGGLIRPAFNMFASLVAGRGRRARGHAGETGQITHRGMPPLGECLDGVSPSERIPQNLFYAPLAFRWLWLGLRYRGLTLPALANPHIEAGGLWGESKSRCMRQIGPDQAHWLAPFVSVERGSGEDSVEDDFESARRALKNAGMSLPVVAKPDVGWQGYGVWLIETEEQLRDYVAAYPENATFMLQDYIPWDGEAGILYVRMPGEESGKVVSITLRYFPYVVGDGHSTLQDLIAEQPRTSFKARYHVGADRLHEGLEPEQLNAVPASGEVVRLAFIGSIRVGGLYRDARNAVTPVLSERFDAIARSMPDFHFGRFDVRFESMDRLREGESFQIIEINGAGAEAIHLWDPNITVREAYRELFRYQTLLFEIGARNRARGFKPMTLRELWDFTVKQHRLIGQYPPSE